MEHDFFDHLVKSLIQSFRFLAWSWRVSRRLRPRRDDTDRTVQRIHEAQEIADRYTQRRHAQQPRRVKIRRKGGGQ